MICKKIQFGHQADQGERWELGLKIFMDNVYIKNSVVVVSVRSGIWVRCKQYYEYSQNYICSRNTPEVQNFKIVIDKEDKCINMRHRNIVRNFNINNTTEGHKQSRSELNTHITS
jgi:hypothetical protein